MRAEIGVQSQTHYEKENIFVSPRRNVPRNAVTQG
jgi:hypothetical protein